MELDKMNLEDVTKRLAELDEEVRAMTVIEEVEKATDNKKALLERKAELEKLEERKINALKIQNNVVEAKTIEKSQEVGKMEERKFTIESQEYRNAWLTKMQGGKPSEIEERALVDAAGAIPTSTMNKIVEQMEYIAPILGKVDLTTIPSNLSIPVEDTVNDASWVAMGTASVDSADELTTITLAAYKLIKTVEIGADVEVMAIGAFESYLVNRLAQKMAKALENAIINGTGAAQPTGLLAAGIITNTGTFTKLGMTYTDLLAIIADLPDHGYRAGASLVMPSALFYSDVLPALTDKGSGLDVQAVAQMKVLGYDVVLCDRVAANTIIFGNLKNYALNLASDIKVESDKSVAFRTGSTVYRAMALVDGKPLNVAAFNSYTRALA